MRREPFGALGSLPPTNSGVIVAPPMLPITPSASGPVEMQVDGCATPFLSDGRLFFLGLRRLQPRAAVLWQIVGERGSSYLMSFLGEDGTTCVAPTCVVAYFGGELQVVVSVDGQQVGTFDAGSEAAICWEPNGPVDDDPP